MCGVESNNYHCVILAHKLLGGVCKLGIRTKKGGTVVRAFLSRMVD